MNRRPFLVAAGLAGSVSVAGCSGRSDEDSNRTPTEDSTPTKTDTPTATEEDLPRPYTKGPAHLLSAYWVQEVPSDIEPYPSDEPPVIDYDVVHTIFDDAVEQDKLDSSNESTRGKAVYWEVSEATFYGIEYDFEDIEGNGEQQQYFNHDGEIVVLKFVIAD